MLVAALSQPSTGGKCWHRCCRAAVLKAGGKRGGRCRQLCGEGEGLFTILDCAREGEGKVSSVAVSRVGATWGR